MGRNSSTAQNAATRPRFFLFFSSYMNVCVRSPARRPRQPSVHAPAPAPHRTHPPTTHPPTHHPPTHPPTIHTPIHPPTHPPSTTHPPTHTHTHTPTHHHPTATDQSSMTELTSMSPTSSMVGRGGSSGFATCASCGIDPFALALLFLAEAGPFAPAYTCTRVRNRG